MSLLQLHQVTMRFGGLTAVDGVDGAVEQGNIQSIIGPNGAGKTTLFNAITGIYEPTSGTITFQGKELRRSMGRMVWTVCVLAGLLTGLFASVCALGVNDLWVATVKRNYNGRDASFSYAGLWQSAVGYWRGDLGLEYGYGSWAVVGSDGQKLAMARTREEADQKREQLQAELDAGTNPRFDNLIVESAKRRRRTWIALLAGMLVGFSGTLAVWSRARRTPDVVARAGIARTFQNIRLFKNMTVLENVLTAMDRQIPGGLLRMALHTPGTRRAERDAERQALEVLEFVGLRKQANDLARNLPYGDQRRLEIARALGAKPQLILLDEPAAGMNPSETADLTRLIDRIRQRGVTVLLIEHHMKLVMGISDHIAVLDYGKKIAEGTPEEIRSNPTVIKAYLGDEEVC